MVHTYVGDFVHSLYKGKVAEMGSHSLLFARLPNTLTNRTKNADRDFSFVINLMSGGLKNSTSLSQRQNLY